MSTELIVIDETKELEYFGEDGAQKALNAVKEHLKDFVHDVTTAKGRALIKSNAAKIGKSGSFLDKLGVKIRAEIQTTKNDRDVLFSVYKEEFRKPLTDWEVEDAKKKKIEADRIAAINLLLNGLTLYSHTVDANGDPLEFEMLQTSYNKLNCIEINESDYQEFKDQAEETKKTILGALESAMQRRKKIDDDQAELALLRRQSGGVIDKAPICENDQKEIFVPQSGINETSDSFLPEDGNEPFHAPLETDTGTVETMEGEPGEGIQLRDLGGVTIEEFNDAFKKIGNATPIDRQRKKLVHNEIKQAVIAFGCTEEQANNFVASLVAGNFPHTKIEY